MKLKVLQPCIIDRYSVVDRIDYNTMNLLGISDKDFIEILGGRKTVAKCLPLNPSDYHLDSISLGEMVIQNAGVKVGDTFETSRIDFLIAKEINFTSPIAIPPVDQYFFLVC